MVEMDAVSVIMPNQPSPMPKSWRSQSVTTSSSSVATGDVRQSMPLRFSAAVTISPRMPGTDAVLAK